VRNKAISSGIWFTISNFIVRAIGFLTTPIFTRLLTHSEFGDFSNFTTWASILLIITSLNLESSLIRARFDFEEDLNRYVFSMIILSMLSTAIWFVIVNIAIGPTENFLSLNRKEIYALFIYLFFTPTINLFQNVERYQYKYKWTVATSMAISVGASLLSVVFVVTFSDKLSGRILGYILPTFIVGLIIFLYYLFRIRRIKLSYWKYALPFTLPFIPHLLSMYLLGSMDRVMIKKMCGAEDLALYSLAYTVGSLIAILITSMNGAFSPWLGEKLSKKQYNKIKQVSLPYVLAFTYFACGVVLIAPEILLIMGGKSYMEAVYVMPPVSAGCVMQFIYCMYVNVEQYEKETVGMAIASAIAALFNYITNYLFIGMFGYVAAAYTTFAGYFVLLLMHMYLVREMGMSFAFDNKKIISIAIGASVIIFLINFILKAQALRFVIFTVYALIGIIYFVKHRRVIMAIVKR
jgi:O-antigen/teichoic acid export membrane protein